MYVLFLCSIGLTVFNLFFFLLEIPVVIDLKSRLKALGSGRLNSFLFGVGVKF